MDSRFLNDLLDNFVAEGQQLRHPWATDSDVIFLGGGGGDGLVDGIRFDANGREWRVMHVGVADDEMNQPSFRGDAQLRDAARVLPPVCFAPLVSQYTRLLRDPRWPVTAVPQMMSAMLHDAVLFHLLDANPLAPLSDYRVSAMTRWWGVMAKPVLRYDNNHGRPLADIVCDITTEEGEEEEKEKEAEEAAAVDGRLSLRELRRGYRDIKTVLTLIAATCAPYRCSRPPNASVSGCTARLVFCKDPSTIYLGLLLNTVLKELPRKVLCSMPVFRLIAEGWGNSPSLLEILRAAWEEYQDVVLEIRGVLGMSDPQQQQQQQRRVRRPLPPLQLPVNALDAAESNVSSSSSPGTDTARSRQLRGTAAEVNEEEEPQAVELGIPLGRDPAASNPRRTFMADYVRAFSRHLAGGGGAAAAAVAADGEVLRNTQSNNNAGSAAAAAADAAAAATTSPSVAGNSAGAAGGASRGAGNTNSGSGSGDHNASTYHAEDANRICLESMRECAESPELLLWWARCRLLAYQLLDSSSRAGVESTRALEFFRQLWACTPLVRDILEDGQEAVLSATLPAEEEEEVSCSGSTSPTSSSPRASATERRRLKALQQRARRLYASLVGTVADLSKFWFSVRVAQSTLTAVASSAPETNTIWSIVNATVPPRRRFQREEFHSYATHWQYALLVDDYVTQPMGFRVSTRGRTMVTQLLHVLSEYPTFYPALVTRTVAMLNRREMIVAELNGRLVSAVARCLRFYLPPMPPVPAVPAGAAAAAAAGTNTLSREAATTAAADAPPSHPIPRRAAASSSSSSSAFSPASSRPLDPDGEQWGGEEEEEVVAEELEAAAASPAAAAAAAQAQSGEDSAAATAAAATTEAPGFNYEAYVVSDTEEDEADDAAQTTHNHLHHHNNSDEEASAVERGEEEADAARRYARLQRRADRRAAAARKEAVRLAQEAAMPVLTTKAYDAILTCLDVLRMLVRNAHLSVNPMGLLFTTPAGATATEEEAARARASADTDATPTTDAPLAACSHSSDDEEGGKSVGGGSAHRFEPDLPKPQCDLYTLLHQLVHQTRYGPLATAALRLFCACVHYNVRDMVPLFAERGLLNTVLAIARRPTASTTTTARASRDELQMRHRLPEKAVSATASSTAASASRDQQPPLLLFALDMVEENGLPNTPRRDGRFDRDGVQPLSATDATPHVSPLVTAHPPPSLLVRYMPHEDPYLNSSSIQMALPEFVEAMTVHQATHGVFHRHRAWIPALLSSLRVSPALGATTMADIEALWSDDGRAAPTGNQNEEATSAAQERDGKMQRQSAQLACRSSPAYQRLMQNLVAEQSAGLIGATSSPSSSAGEAIVDDVLLRLAELCRLHVKREEIGYKSLQSSVRDMSRVLTEVLQPSTLLTDFFRPALHRELTHLSRGVRQFAQLVRAGATHPAPFLASTVTATNTAPSPSSTSSVSHSADTSLREGPATESAAATRHIDANARHRRPRPSLTSPADALLLLVRAAGLCRSFNNFLALFSAMDWTGQRRGPRLARNTQERQESMQAMRDILMGTVERFHRVVQQLWSLMGCQVPLRLGGSPLGVLEQGTASGASSLLSYVQVIVGQCLHPRILGDYLRNTQPSKTLVTVLYSAVRCILYHSTRSLYYLNGPSSLSRSHSGDSTDETAEAAAAAAHTDGYGEVHATNANTTVGRQRQRGEERFRRDHLLQMLDAAAHHHHHHQYDTNTTAPQEPVRFELTDYPCRDYVSDVLRPLSLGDGIFVRQLLEAWRATTPSASGSGGSGGFGGVVGGPNRRDTDGTPWKSVFGEILRFVVDATIVRAPFNLAEVPNLLRSVRSGTSGSSGGGGVHGGLPNMVVSLYDRSTETGAALTSGAAAAAAAAPGEATATAAVPSAATPVHLQGVAEAVAHAGASDRLLQSLLQDTRGYVAEPSTAWMTAEAWREATTGAPPPPPPPPTSATAAVVPESAAVTTSAAEMAASHVAPAQSPPPQPRLPPSPAAAAAPLPASGLEDAIVSVDGGDALADSQDSPMSSASSTAAARTPTLQLTTVPAGLPPHMTEEEAVVDGHPVAEGRRGGAAAAAEEAAAAAAPSGEASAPASAVPPLFVPLNPVKAVQQWAFMSLFNGRRSGAEQAMHDFFHITAFRRESRARATLPISAAALLRSLHDDLGIAFATAVRGVHADAVTREQCRTGTAAIRASEPEKYAQAVDDVVATRRQQRAAAAAAAARRRVDSADGGAVSDSSAAGDFVHVPVCPWLQAHPRDLATMELPAVMNIDACLADINYTAAHRVLWQLAVLDAVCAGGGGGSGGGGSGSNLRDIDSRNLVRTLTYAAQLLILLSRLFLSTGVLNTRQRPRRSTANAAEARAQEDAAAATAGVVAAGQSELRRCLVYMGVLMMTFLEGCDSRARGQHHIIVESLLYCVLDVWPSLPGFPMLPHMYVTAVELMSQLRADTFGSLQLEQALRGTASATATRSTAGGGSATRQGARRGEAQDSGDRVTRATADSDGSSDEGDGGERAPRRLESHGVQHPPGPQSTREHAPRRAVTSATAAGATALSEGEARTRLWPTSFDPFPESLYHDALREDPGGFFGLFTHLATAERGGGGDRGYTTLPSAPLWERLLPWVCDLVTGSIFPLSALSKAGLQVLRRRACKVFWSLWTATKQGEQPVVLAYMLDRVLADTRRNVVLLEYMAVLLSQSRGVVAVEALALTPLPRVVVRVVRAAIAAVAQERAAWEKEAAAAKAHATTLAAQRALREMCQRRRSSFAAMQDTLHGQLVSFLSLFQDVRSDAPLLRDRFKRTSTTTPQHAQTMGTQCNYFDGTRTTFCWHGHQCHRHHVIPVHGQRGQREEEEQRFSLFGFGSGSQRVVDEMMTVMERHGFEAPPLFSDGKERGGGEGSGAAATTATARGKASTTAGAAARTNASTAATRYAATASSDGEDGESTEAPAAPATATTTSTVTSASAVDRTGAAPLAEREGEENRSGTQRSVADPSALGVSAIPRPEWFTGAPAARGRSSPHARSAETRAGRGEGSGSAVASRERRAGEAERDVEASVAATRRFIAYLPHRRRFPEVPERAGDDANDGAAADAVAGWDRSFDDAVGATGTGGPHERPPHAGVAGESVALRHVLTNPLDGRRHRVDPLRRSITPFYALFPREICEDVLRLCLDYMATRLHDEEVRRAEVEEEAAAVQREQQQQQQTVVPPAGAEVRPSSTADNSVLVDVVHEGRPVAPSVDVLSPVSPALSQPPNLSPTVAAASTAPTTTQPASTAAAAAATATAAVARLASRVRLPAVEVAECQVGEVMVHFLLTSLFTYYRSCLHVLRTHRPLIEGCDAATTTTTTDALAVLCGYLTSVNLPNREKSVILSELLLTDVARVEGDVWADMMRVLATTVRVHHKGQRLTDKSYAVLVAQHEHRLHTTEAKPTASTASTTATTTTSTAAAAAAAAPPLQHAAGVRRSSTAGGQRRRGRRPSSASPPPPPPAASSRPASTTDLPYTHWADRPDGDAPRPLTAAEDRSEDPEGLHHHIIPVSIFLANLEAYVIRQPTAFYGAFQRYCEVRWVEGKPGDMPPAWLGVWVQPRPPAGAAAREGNAGRAVRAGRRARASTVAAAAAPAAASSSAAAVWPSVAPAMPSADFVARVSCYMQHLVRSVELGLCRAAHGVETLAAVEQLPGVCDALLALPATLPVPKTFATILTTEVRGAASQPADAQSNHDHPHEESASPAAAAEEEEEESQKKKEAWQLIPVPPFLALALHFCGTLSAADRSNPYDFAAGIDFAAGLLGYTPFVVADAVLDTLQRLVAALEGCTAAFSAESNEGERQAARRRSLVRCLHGLLCFLECGSPRPATTALPARQRAAQQSTGGNAIQEAFLRFYRHLGERGLLPLLCRVCRLQTCEHGRDATSLLQLLYHQLLACGEYKMATMLTPSQRDYAAQQQSTQEWQRHTGGVSGRAGARLAAAAAAAGEAQVPGEVGALFNSTFLQSMPRHINSRLEALRVEAQLMHAHEVARRSSADSMHRLHDLLRDLPGPPGEEDEEAAVEEDDAEDEEEGGDEAAAQSIPSALMRNAPDFFRNAMLDGMEGTGGWRRHQRSHPPPSEPEGVVEEDEEEAEPQHDMADEEAWAHRHAANDAHAEGEAHGRAAHQYRSSHTTSSSSSSSSSSGGGGDEDGGHGDNGGGSPISPAFYEIVWEGYTSSNAAEETPTGAGQLAGGGGDPLQADAAGNEDADTEEEEEVVGEHQESDAALVPPDRLSEGVWELVVSDGDTSEDRPGDEEVEEEEEEETDDEEEEMEEDEEVDGDEEDEEFNYIGSSDMYDDDSGSFLGDSTLDEHFLVPQVQTRFRQALYPFEGHNDGGRSGDEGGNNNNTGGGGGGYGAQSATERAQTFAACAYHAILLTVRRLHRGNVVETEGPALPVLHATEERPATAEEPPAARSPAQHHSGSENATAGGAIATRLAGSGASAEVSPPPVIARFAPHRAAAAAAAAAASASVSPPSVQERTPSEQLMRRLRESRSPVAAPSSSSSSSSSSSEEQVVAPSAAAASSEAPPAQPAAPSAAPAAPLDDVMARMLALFAAGDASPAAAAAAPINAAPAADPAPALPEPTEPEPWEGVLDVQFLREMPEDVRSEILFDSMQTLRGAVEREVLGQRTRLYTGFLRAMPEAGQRHAMEVEQRWVRVTRADDSASELYHTLLAVDAETRRDSLLQCDLALLQPYPELLREATELRAEAEQQREEQEAALRAQEEQRQREAALRQARMQRQQRQWAWGNLDEAGREGEGWAAMAGGLRVGAPGMSEMRTVEGLMHALYDAPWVMYTIINHELFSARRLYRCEAVLQGLSGSPAAPSGSRLAVDGAGGGDALPWVMSPLMEPSGHLLPPRVVRDRAHRVVPYRHAASLSAPLPSQPTTAFTALTSSGSGNSPPRRSPSPSSPLAAREEDGETGELTWRIGSVATSLAALSESIVPVQESPFHPLSLPLPELPHDVVSRCLELLRLRATAALSLPFNATAGISCLDQQLQHLLQLLMSNQEAATRLVCQLFDVMINTPTIADEAADATQSAPSASALAANQMFIKGVTAFLVSLIKQNQAMASSFFLLPDGALDGATLKPVEAPMDAAERRSAEMGLWDRLWRMCRQHIHVQGFLYSLDQLLRQLVRSQKMFHSAAEDREVTNADDPLSSEPLTESLILHPRHPHRLRWTNIRRLSNYEEGGYVCNICGVNPGYDYCFHCTSCQFDLCPSCSRERLTLAEMRTRISRSSALMLMAVPETVTSMTAFLRHPLCRPNIAANVVQLMSRGLQECAARESVSPLSGSLGVATTFPALPSSPLGAAVSAASAGSAAPSTPFASSSSRGNAHASAASAAGPLQLLEQELVQMAETRVRAMKEARDAFRLEVHTILNRKSTTGGISSGGVVGRLGHGTVVNRAVYQQLSIPDGYIFDTDTAMALLVKLDIKDSEGDAMQRLFEPYVATSGAEPRTFTMLWRASQAYLHDVTTLLEHLTPQEVLPLPSCVSSILQTFCRYHLGDVHQRGANASARTLTGSRSNLAGETEHFLRASTKPSSVSDKAVRELAEQEDAAQWLTAVGTRLSEEGLNAAEEQQRRLPHVVRMILEENRVTLNTLLHWDGSLLKESLSFLKYEPNLIDFNFKLSDFRRRLGLRRGSNILLRVKRDNCLLDSFKELQKQRSLGGQLHVRFEGEEGADAGGLTREWLQLLSEALVDERYALFVHSQDSASFQPNPFSSVNPNHLDYFQFAGVVVALAITHNVPIDIHFTRAFYRHIIGHRPVFADLQSFDPELYTNLNWIMENDVTNLALTFAVNYNRFGSVEEEELEANGKNTMVTNANKQQYVRLLCEFHMTRRTEEQLLRFLKGFYSVIPRREIQCFTENELELVISGMPDIDVEDLRTHTVYEGYSSTSPQIRWFWEAVSAMTKEDLANLLQFTTGSSKVPHGGFGHLEGSNGRSLPFTISRWAVDKEDRLPQAHTCFNKIDLPVYTSAALLKEKLMLAITYGSMGFTMV